MRKVEMFIRNYFSNYFESDVYLAYHLNVMREQNGDDFDIGYEIGSYLCNMIGEGYDEEIAETIDKFVIEYNVENNIIVNIYIYDKNCGEETPVFVLENEVVVR